MGIVSSDNVHNVKITAQVRRACIYPYMGIVSPYIVLNVKVTAWVRRAYTYSDVHIWLLYTILGLLAGHIQYLYTTENIISIYGHCIVMWRTIHNVYCAGHVHDKDYHIRIWALYRHLTNIYNLACTYMSINTIHNVNYSTRMYLHANADLWAYAHGNISIYGNF